MGNIVAIVGRPNVGKSTLFNRLVGMKKAIVNEEAGTTRDRHYGKSEWNGKEFSVIDTGGYSINSDDIFEDDIRRQVLLAIEEADVIVFMVDVTTGITDLDMAMTQIMRKSSKKIVLATNKVDNGQRMYDVHEFYKLGIGDPIALCAMSGSGTGELLDAISECLPEGVPAEQDLLDSELPKFVIVGRPNVGKSSLTNALLGTERNIVTSIAGTTRDSVHTRYTKFGMDFFLIDTAGVRKKGKVEENLEFYSVLRSIRSIETADVCIIMLDATQGVEAQDMNLFQLAVKNKKGCVIVVNKWDLVEKETSTMKTYTETLAEKLAPFNDVPVIFISALTKQRIMDVLQAAMQVYDNRNRKVSTSQLNDYILPFIETTPPPSIKGKYIHIKFATQLPTPTPQFAFFVNLPQYVKDSYRRFLENKIRSKWDFKGVPIQIYFRLK
ncbi:MAG: ribosome biogenesis GTPase Der [Rikenellaceae bacterium]